MLIQELKHEILFKNLFLLFTDNYKLGLHHGSLSKEHRQKTEEKFINEEINTIISTSSLELGIDFKNIDQVLNIGTPKSINRLIQRAGRSHHYFSGIPTSYLNTILINLNIWNALLQKNCRKNAV